MAETEKNEFVPITELFKRQKEVIIADDSGQKSRILMVKMNQHERAESLKAFNETRQIELARLMASDLDKKDAMAQIELLEKDGIIKILVEIEKLGRSEIVDLFPFKEGLSEEDRKKEEEKLLVKWEKDRAIELEKEDIESLRKKLLEMRFRTLAVLTAGIEFNKASIFYMARDPVEKDETGQPKRIFKNKEDVARVFSAKILDELSKIVDEFRVFESNKAVRGISERPDFKPAGDSQESSKQDQDSKT